MISLLLWYRLCYRSLTVVTMILALLGPLLLTVLTPASLLAQSVVPPACLDDRGNALDPKEDGWWLLVLNFNHEISSQVTTGCVVYRHASQPQPVYQLIQCPLINNRQGTAVGDGAAKFDGNFWIECQLPTTVSDLKHFGIRASAHFTQPSMTYTIVDHPDVSLSAWVNEDWQLGLNSRYGAVSFNHGTTAPVALQPVALLSHVQESSGEHIINGVPLQPTVTVDLFDVDDSFPFRVGGPGQRWSLTELLIDPPGFCSSGCG